MEDEEWGDPSTDGPERQELAIRLACSAAVLVVLVAMTRGFLLESLPMLWPPTEPLAQWSTLVLLFAFGYILVPLMIGSFITDVLVNRLRDVS